MTTSVFPELRFRLPGKWYSIDVSSEAAADESARRMAEELVGTSDEAALVRIKLRERVRRAAEGGRAGAIRAMFLATELQKGVALPATLTVFEPPKLRMAPAVGTSPEAVAGTMRKALAEVGVDGIEEAEELDCGAFRALRISRIEAEGWSPTALDESGVDADAAARYPFAYSPEATAEAERSVQRRLVIEYWCTVPESKQVLVVVCSTPLGDIAHAMVRLFDSILTAATYVPAPREEAATSLAG
ncbi:MAG: hypothetical protein J7480_06430 [Microbacteriaceae bacterium]|nr:hypothetical protein [Microbacteriaceae bacterium]